VFHTEDVVNDWLLIGLREDEASKASEASKQVHHNPL
jgi:hypothetical protein